MSDCMNARVELAVSAENEGAGPEPRPPARVDPPRPGKWDFFICHASEDKSAVVEPLAEALRELGFRVWYDDWELRVGDSLRRSIDAGLIGSRYGIVVLSRSFFLKGWPQRELDGLAQKERLGHKVILPVWHGVTRDEVASHSPLLADRLAAKTTGGIAEVADRIVLAASATVPQPGTGARRTATDPLGPQKRSEVLEAISGLHAIIDSLCRGSVPPPDIWLKIAGEFADANADVRRQLDRNSPWLDPDWIAGVEQLRELGLRIMLEHQGGGAGTGGATEGPEPAAHSCREFRLLLRALRGG